MSIAVVGALGFDDIETPQGGVQQVLGGSATYVAAAAALLAPVSIVSVVGDDFPERWWEAMQDRGIDLESVQRVAGATFQWGCRYHANLEDRDTLFTRPGTFASTDVRVGSSAAEATYVFLTAGDPRQNLTALSGFGARRITMLDTIEREIVEERTALLESVGHANIVSINAAEAALLVPEAGTPGVDTADRAHEFLQRHGATTLLLKRGPAGVEIRDGDRRGRVEAVRDVRVVDPTGAGDAFAGGVLSALDRGAPLEDAVRWGCAVASITVEAFGPQRLLETTREEVSERGRSIGLGTPDWLGAARKEGATT